MICDYDVTNIRLGALSVIFRSKSKDWHTQVYTGLYCYILGLLY